MILVNIISFFLLYYLKKFFGGESFSPELKRYFKWGMIASGALFVTGVSELPPKLLFDFLSLLLVGGIIFLIINSPELEKQKNLAVTPLPIVVVYVVRFLLETFLPQYFDKFENYLTAAGFFAIIWAVTMWLNHRKEMKSLQIERLISKEKERQLFLAQERKQELERLVQERTSEILSQKEELQEALNHLKSTQDQLVQQEKLASLGQLTAGIAHEIKNPLNFINNFSELSEDFLVEIESELKKDPEKLDMENMLDLLEDVKSNMKKIRHHGTRADKIVKSMLLHSRGEKGEYKETDLNSLIGEYSNLAFHGMRANPNPINVEIVLNLDQKIPPINLNAEDFSRVILNLTKNAFDAMRDKINAVSSEYKAKLEFRTKDLKDKVLLEIEDNGPGVPEEIRDKLLMPFFTTKKGTDGTGLGLSITHDIVKSHGGTLEIESKVGEFTRFKILLPKA
ncbi:phospho-acceptor domain-containing protein [Algoriphagus boseongensis]|uniref:histidine kinase n=1 Tax=Algoriphagus boseongensis TaxID=1442587 RepID=A0A4V6PW47_9BACT|nr:ATP-binding protein [Algoriphagus boseongensis]TDQ16920.1 phospho-acceptor domain-containing protein [Algoriphagus boseongensis]